MAKKKENHSNTPNHEVHSPLIVNAQYIKDLSFENPSPLSYVKESSEKPSISVHIEAQATPKDDRTFEVALRIRVDAKQKEAQVFILDLEYAGAFTIGKEVPEEYIRPILMIECPRVLFPFARHVVGTLTQESGYPPLLLTPVDFADLYQRQVEKEPQEKQKRPEVLQ